MQRKSAQNRIRLFRLRQDRVLSGRPKGRLKRYIPIAACSLNKHRNYLFSGGTDFTVLEEDQTEELSREERRQFDRSRLIVDVYFDGADLTGVASTKDISLGGLYLSTQVEIPKGSTLTLRIPIGREHIVVRGDVVYSLPGHGVGVRFHRLSDEKRALMERELLAQ
jgi:hypothetical protein